MLQMNLSKKNRNQLTDIENRFVAAKGEWVGERKGSEFGVSRSKLLCAEWINKVLLYSTGNYIHYPVINHNGKQFSKKCIFMYNRITLLYSRINTAL